MKRFLFVFLFAALLVSCSTDQVSYENHITPAPLSFIQGKGEFLWDNPVKVVLTGDTIDQTVIETAFSYISLPYKFVDDESKADIRLQLSAGDGKQVDESYKLTVTKKGVTVQASSMAGLFYGIQTLIQMTDVETGKTVAATVVDAPRFSYRGMMIDVSRHFHSKEFVMKQIDLIAKYKMNRFHFHLTDGAGWRLQIDRYPRLTEFAAWRKPALLQDWWDGGRQYCEQDDPEASGGFYTKDDIREILEYARRRCVTVIPEIEMPGHSEEVLTAYPQLSCTHVPYKQTDFCIGNEKTFEFLENVLEEVIELFPSEYIHIGGDEAGKASWKTCPLCRKRMREEGLSNVDELQSYLVSRIEKFLNSKGRALLGWDEILEGGLAPNATVMSWRGTEGGVEAINSGHKAIMTPGAYCYLDSYQDAPSSQPKAFGGYLPLKKVYGYDPVPDTLTLDEAKLLLGIQANLWSEHIPTDDYCEYMLYPRAIAVAETGWSEPENKSWEQFRERILNDVLPYMRSHGYNPFDLSKEVGDREESKEPLDHLALGKKVTYNAPYWENYPANGDETLTDGLRGGWNYNDARWLGFVTDNRVDVTIDLEEVKDISYIGADFMQICGPGVYFPKKVLISVSTDGKTFKQLAEIDHEVQKDDEVSFKNFGWEGQASARYIRYRSFPEKRFGGVHFIDEIVVK